MTIRGCLLWTIWNYKRFKTLQKKISFNLSSLISHLYLSCCLLSQIQDSRFNLGALVDSTEYKMVVMLVAQTR